MNNRLFEVRKNLHLSQEKFGQALGVTGAGISRIESGHRKVTEQMAKAVCREFGVNLYWLQTGEGEMFDKPDPDGDLYDLIGTVLNDKDPFVVNTFKAFARLDKKSWEILHQLALDMCKDDPK